jgi:hypothetical protein
MELWTQDGNLLEGAEMLAVHQSIKPKINHSSSKNEEMDTGWKPPRRRGDATCPSINQTENQSFIKEKGKHGHGMETS